jgi:cytochrome c oxidase assembly protein subunit 15
MLALIAVQWVAQIRFQRGILNPLPNRALTILLAVTIAQAVIGIVQSRLGVPAFLVALHMLGAATLSSLVTFQYLLFRSKR